MPPPVSPARGAFDDPAPLTLSAPRAVEARLILVAKWTYVSLVPLNTDAAKLARAAGIAQQADAATAANDPLATIDHWWQAVRLLAPGK
jgi:hypothetical protein